MAGGAGRLPRANRPDSAGELLFVAAIDSWRPSSSPDISSAHATHEKFEQPEGLVSHSPGLVAIAIYPGEHVKIHLTPIGVASSWGDTDGILSGFAYEITV